MSWEQRAAKVERRSNRKMAVTGRGLLTVLAPLERKRAETGEVPPRAQGKQKKRR